MGIFDKLFGKESTFTEVKEVYTWFVATDVLRDAVRDDIIVTANRMLAQKHEFFRNVLEQVAKRNVPNHISIGKASSEHFAESFAGWLKSKGISIDIINIKPPYGKSVFFLAGDADDPVTSKSFEWGVFIYLRS